MNKDTEPKTSTFRREEPSYSMLPSVDALVTYGIPRSSAIYMQNNHWIIPTEFRDIVSTYYLLHWSAPYFQEKLKEGTVERNGVIYQVIYYRCNAAAIGTHSRKLLLSFRELKAEYKVQPVVLVTVS